MTVNTTSITSGPYTGDGTAAEYSYTFRVDDKSELNVYETDTSGVETLLTVDTDYTVNNVGTDGGGTITRLAGNLPTGYTWYIRANYPATQLTALSSQGGFFPDVHEKAFDKVTFLIQQLLDSVSRCFRVSDSNSEAAAVTTVPDAATRANKYLYFDAAGNLSLAMTVAGSSVSLVVAKAGDTMTGNLRFGNLLGITGNDTGGAEHNLIKLNGSSLIEIGDVALYSLEINGGYLCVVSSSNYYATGAYHNGTNWVATATSAQITDLTNRIHYVDTGLTIGNSFTPTEVFAIDATGKITNGALNYPDTIITNKPKAASDATYPLINNNYLQVDLSLTVNTWIDVGPTGSGATVIWTGLDSIPADADWIKVKVYYTTTATTPGIVGIQLNNRPHGSLATTSSSQVILGISWQWNDNSSGGSPNYGMWYGVVSLDANNLSDFYWSISNANVHTMRMYITEYGYN